MVSLEVKFNEEKQLTARWTFKFGDTVDQDSPIRTGFVIVYDTLDEFAKKVNDLCRWLTLSVHSFIEA